MKELINRSVVINNQSDLKKKKKKKNKKERADDDNTDVKQAKEPQGRPGDNLKQ